MAASRIPHGSICLLIAGRISPIAWRSLPRWSSISTAALAEIIDLLKKTGELDNTLIVFTSDNGACYEWGPLLDLTCKAGRESRISTRAKTSKRSAGRARITRWGSAWSCLSNTPLRMYKHYNHEGGNCSPSSPIGPEGIAQPDRWVRTPMHLFDLMPTPCAKSPMPNIRKRATGNAFTRKRG